MGNTPPSSPFPSSHLPSQNNRFRHLSPNPLSFKQPHRQSPFHRQNSPKDSPLLKRFKSAENGAFDALPHTTNYAKARQRRKNEKRTMAETEEAVDFCKSLSVSLFNCQLNQRLNAVSNLLDSNSTEELNNRFSKETVPKIDEKVMRKELDYLLNSLVDKEEEEEGLVENDIEEEEGLFKKLSTPSHNTLRSKEQWENPQSGFKLPTNGVFSFHKDIQNINNSNKKKKSDEPVVIEERSFDDSFGTSKYEHISENSLINRQWLDRQNKNKTNSGFTEEFSGATLRDSEIRQEEESRFRFERQRPTEIELSTFKTTKIQHNETLKRDSYSKRIQSKNFFEKPRKLDIMTVKGKIDDKPHRFSRNKPKHIAINIAQLSKVKKKKGFNNFMQKTKKNREEKEVKKTNRNIENMFFDKRYKSTTETNLPFKRDNSYKRLYEKKKEQKNNDLFSHHKRRNSSNLVLAKNNPLEDKLNKKSEKIVDQKKGHKRAFSSFGRKMSLNNLSKPAKKNSFKQKFRQSAKKTASIGRCYGTQIESIKNSKEESIGLEQESVEFDVYEKIIDGFNNPLKQTLAKKPSKVFLEQFQNKRKEDSLYSKSFKTTNQSSRNSSKHNVKIDISGLSKKMKFDLDSCFKKSRGQL